MSKRQLHLLPVISLILLASAMLAFCAALPGEKPLPVASVAVDRNDMRATHLVVTLPKLDLESLNRTGNDLRHVTLEGEPSTVRPGWPELPMVARAVLVPPTSGVHLVINHLDYRTLEGYHPFIAPAQDGSVDLETSGQPDAEYQSLNGFWPPDPVVISDPVIIRGYRIVQITSYPMQVNPATGEVRYNDNIDFDLTYEGEGINPVVNPNRPRPSASMDRILQNLVVNPPLPRRDNDLPQHGSYLLVYLNANGVANSLQPLINWRMRMGWDVQTLALNTNSSYSQVKQAIQQVYNGNNPPEMIALVGDPDAGGFGIPAWPNQTDHDYALLDGNDRLSDADYGRLTSSNTHDLDVVVGKIVNYESGPYMEDTSWYHQGAVCAGASVSGLSTILVNKWVRRETMERGWTSVDEWYFTAPFQGQDVPTFFHNEVARGINFITYRGWIGMSGINDGHAFDNYQATRRYPFATTLTCASGQYIGQFSITEGFLLSPGGAIGAIGFCTANTHVPYNNAVFSGIWQGLLKYGLYNLGTASEYGRIELYRQYHSFEEDEYNNFSDWANLMGDPATEMWTGVPMLIDVTHAQNLPLGGSRASVRVVQHNSDNPIVGANVCLYKANDHFQMVVVTNSSGVAEFTIPSEALSQGNLLVTVTKHNLKPYLGQISVGQADYYMGADSWEVINDNDGDGHANPGETFDLNVAIKNFGNAQPDGAVTVSAESLAPAITVTGDPVEINPANAPGESTTVSFSMQADASAPDGLAIPIAITAQSGDTSWKSMASIQIVAPKIKIKRLTFQTPFRPGIETNLNVTLANVGHQQLDATNAVMWCADSVITLVNPNATFDTVNPNDTVRIDGNQFRIRADSLTVPGTTVTLMMAVATNGGFCDTSSFDVTIGQPAVTDPFGPDKYGYVCFDSGDHNWVMCPRYNWVEIDPAIDTADFHGNPLNITDGGEDADQSIAVDLPFPFQYYGKSFSKLTVCTNGWAAFGDWRELSNFRNRRVASAEGPDAMLSVFWDDLNTGRVIAYYDQDSSRFIVEWNNMTFDGGGGGNETFELMLYNPRVHQTYSGDGVIVYQYKTISNQNGAGPSNDTPFATVGISNLDNTSGMEYTYYNTYPTGAKHLENRMAIKFTTAVTIFDGVLNGRVTDAATGSPISHTLVAPARGSETVTNDNGEFSIPDILIGNYGSITFSAQGYNDSTWLGPNDAGFSITKNETLNVDISLLHPEFTLDRDKVTYELMKDSTLRDDLTISNTGNGTLWFSSRYVYNIDHGRDLSSTSSPHPLRKISRDESDEQWDPLLNWDVSAPTGNIRMQSIAYVRDHWLIAGGHINAQDTNSFYEFDRNGHYTGNHFAEPVQGSYGIRGMHYNDADEALYCAWPDSSWIMKIDPTNGQEMEHWRTPRPFVSIRNITMDPATGYIWASGVTGRLYKLELVADTLQILGVYQTLDPRTNAEIHGKYGLAWFPDDPDGFDLYLISNDNPTPSDTLPYISIFKMNPQTGEIRFLTGLGNLNPAYQARCGLVITPKWNNLVWTLATVFDNPGGDVAQLLELSPNSSWIDYSPRSDTLQAGDFTPIELNLNTTDLDTGHYGVIIQFSHNAGNGVTRVPIYLNLVDTLILDEQLNDNAKIPLEYSLSPVWPNPFNSRTTIAYALKSSGLARLDVFDLEGRLVSELINRQQAAGRYRLTFDAADLPAGLYFYRLRAGSFTATQKMLLVK